LALAKAIVALVAPNITILLEGVVLKLVPLIVTGSPTGPEIGEKEVMVGWAIAHTWQMIRNATKARFME
jgi:hypothetical protein